VCKIVVYCYCSLGRKTSIVFCYAQFFGVLGGVLIKGQNLKIDPDDPGLRIRGIYFYSVNCEDFQEKYPPVSVDDTGSVAQCILITVFTEVNYGFLFFHRRRSSNFFLRNYENIGWDSWKKIQGNNI